MGPRILGATRHCPALALSLVLFGCAKPLATLEVVEPAAAPPALERSKTKVSISRSARVVAIARSQLGLPYAWGGSGPAGFDCSGFVMYVFSRVGVALPHNAAKQYRYGTAVNRERLQPGDVVFFAGLQHDGIYVGDGHFIHARRSGGRVMISGLGESWYRARWVGGRRYLSHVPTAANRLITRDAT